MDARRLAAAAFGSRDGGPKYPWVPVLVLALALGGILAACGPSQEQLLTKTAAAATVTPTVTRTPTASPEPTPTSTATPTPRPDSKALLDWQALELPPRFSGIPPSQLGIEAGAHAYSLIVEGTPRPYSIAGSFLLADPEADELLYGYSVGLPGPSDVQLFQFILDDFDQFVGNAFARYPGSGIEALPGAAAIGDSSAGASVVFHEAGVAWRIDEVAFQVGNIGAFVFVRRPESAVAAVDPTRLAEVYAHSLVNPPARCRVSSLEAVEGATWPAYIVSAEGFYPWEGRMIALNGEAVVDGAPTRTGAFLAGGGGESAGPDGRLEAQVTFPLLVGTDVQPPSSLTLIIHGYASGCEVTETVSWPFP